MQHTTAITKYIGIALVILALLHASDKVQLTPIYVFSLSVAGFLFILFDWANLLVERLIKEKKPKRKRAAYWLRAILLMGSSFSIIILPFVLKITDDKYLSRLSDNLVLLGLGIVIFLIGLKSEYEFDKKLTKLECDVELLGAQTKDLKKKSETLLEINEDLKKILSDQGIEYPKRDN